MEVLSELIYLVFSAVTLTLSVLASTHVAQRVAFPLDKAIWISIILIFPIVGPAVYLFSKYQKLRSIGKGGILLTSSHFNFSSFFKLNEIETVKATE